MEKNGDTSPDAKTDGSFIMPEDRRTLMGFKEDMPVIRRRRKSLGIGLLMVATILFALGHGAQLVYIFAMMPFIVAFLVHAGMLVVLIEVFTKTLPRVALLLPILFYGGFYAMYLHREITFAKIEAEYREQNEKSYTVLDLTGHDLVLNQHEQHFAAKHGLVAYSLPSDTYGSLKQPTRWTPMPKEACSDAPFGHQHIDQSDSTYVSVSEGLLSHCMFVEHAEPQKTYFVAKVKRRRQIAHGLRIDENVITVEQDGFEVSRYVDIGTSDAMTSFPLMIFPCAIPWRDRYGHCEHPFQSARRDLDALPDSFGGKRPTLATMLGLPDERPHAGDGS